MKIRWMTIVAGMSLGVLGVSGCGDDSMSGPAFGDIEFTPTFENIGTGRTIELILTNAASVELGPIVVGNDFPKHRDFPDVICTTMSVTVAPSNVATLAPDDDVTIDISIDTSGVDPDACEFAEYDVDVLAAVDGQVLGAATVRFDWAGNAP